MIPPHHTSKFTQANIPWYHTPCLSVDRYVDLCGVLVTASLHGRDMTHIGPGDIHDLLSPHVGVTQDYPMTGQQVGPREGLLHQPQSIQSTNNQQLMQDQCRTNAGPMQSNLCVALILPPPLSTNDSPTQTQTPPLPPPSSLLLLPLLFFLSHSFRNSPTPHHPSTKHTMSDDEGGGGGRYADDAATYNNEENEEEDMNNIDMEGNDPPH